MPELPEIETIRRSLEPLVLDRTITKIDIRERRMRRPIPDGFEAAAGQRTIRKLSRRGKYLLWHLDDDRIMLFHLGMSGSLVVRSEGQSRAVHDHVLVTLDSHDVVAFNDPRRFGLLRLGWEDGLDELRNVGPDPLDTPLTVDQWRRAVRHRKIPIKNLLMDQKFLAGIGNIYANEMLHAAGIRPRRRACNLRRGELERLDHAMRAILEKAVALGGSSISDFRDASGKPGYFQIHHAVYGRAGEPCRHCKTAIRKVLQSGRSSFYCPRCQR